jgi:uncharacterized membrane protein YfcA
VTPLQAGLALMIFAAGACVQGGVGFGANLIAAPLLLLVSPRFVPGPVVVASAVLNLLVTYRHRGGGHVDPSVRIAIVGQLVGTVAAGAVMATLPSDSLSVLFAILVLVAVVLSSAGLHLRPTPPNLTGAGIASGFMGTVSGIGGPPIALAYLHLSGPQLRATLGRFFLVGNLFAIPTLIVVGKLGRDELVPCLILAPGAVLGFLGSGWLAAHLDRRTARPVILGLSVGAAIAVLVRSIG